MSAHDTSDPNPEISIARPNTVGRRQMFGFLAGVAAAVPLTAWWMRGRCRGLESAADVPGHPPAVDEPSAAPAPTCGNSYQSPRMIVVIPADGSAQYDLGKAFGEYLNHGTDEQLAPLALLPLECVAAGEIELPKEVHGSGPFALLVVAPGYSHLRRFELPAFENNAHIDWDVRDQRADAVIDRRIDALAAAVRDAIMPDGRVDPLLCGRAAGPSAMAGAAATAGAAAEVGAATGAETGGETEAEAACADSDGAAAEPAPVAGARAAEIVERIIADDFVPLSDIEHFAPEIMVAVLASGGASRDALLAALAMVVRDNLVEGSVRGADWARSSGCGTRFEGRERHVGYACGMGYVAERSQRFLHFYTADGEL